MDFSLSHFDLSNFLNLNFYDIFINDDVIYNLSLRTHKKYLFGSNVSTAAAATTAIKMLAKIL